MISRPALLAAHILIRQTNEPGTFSGAGIESVNSGVAANGRRACNFDRQGPHLDLAYLARHRHREVVHDEDVAGIL